MLLIRNLSILLIFLLCANFVLALEAEVIDEANVIDEKEIASIITTSKLDGKIILKTVEKADLDKETRRLEGVKKCTVYILYEKGNVVRIAFEKCNQLDEAKFLFLNSFDVGKEYDKKLKELVNRVIDILSGKENEWFLCASKTNKQNICTKFKKDCDQVYSIYSNLKDCEKDKAQKRRLIFITINQEDYVAITKFKLRKQLDYYQKVHGLGDESVLAIWVGKGCEISEFKADESGKEEAESAKKDSGMQSCGVVSAENKEKSAVEEKKEPLTRDDSIRNKLIKCAKNEIKDLRVSDAIIGVVYDNALGPPGYSYEEMILLDSDSSEEVLAHEMGHKELGYCDEYQYAFLREDSGVFECLDPLKGSLKDYVDKAIPYFKIPKDESEIDIGDSNVKIKVKGDIILYFNFEKINENQVKISVDREYKYGWSL